jgi:hypothetical protein
MSRKDSVEKLQKLAATAFQNHLLKSSNSQDKESIDKNASIRINTGISIEN